MTTNRQQGATTRLAHPRQHRSNRGAAVAVAWHCAAHVLGWATAHVHAQTPEHAPLSMHFQNIEMRTALQVIADFSGLNIVVSDAVTGAVTLRMKEVPWPQALEALLQAKGLGQKRSGNVLWVAPRTEIAARERQELEANVALQNLEPLQTRSFELNYARAGEVVLQLLGTGANGAIAMPGALGTLGPLGSAAPWGPFPSPYLGNTTSAGSTTSVAGNLTSHAAGAWGANSGSPRMLSPRGSAIAESRTNQLFVTDVAERLAQVAAMLQKIDVPLRQIMIEAHIVEASDSFGKSLGIRMGAIDASASNITVGNSYGAAVNNARMPGATSAGVDVSGNWVNLPASPLNGTAATSFAVSVYDASKTRLLGLEISALESLGEGKVVSSPRVVTANQFKAVIEQGTELPYQAATSSGATSIAFRKANLKLEVTPHVAPMGGIILDLDISKDSVGQPTLAGYAIDTKHINTQVLVDNGGTVVIGGIFEQNDTSLRNQVPLLADIPGLGWLFRNSLRASKKQELLVFITPKMAPMGASARE